MTQIKERAVEMIQRMPDENMFYVINILQNLEAMLADRAKAALEDTLCMEKRLPKNFDPEKRTSGSENRKYDIFLKVLTLYL